MARKATRSRASSLGIALVGTGFMGRAHANAWRQAPCFFDLSPRPALQAVAGTKAASTRAFADRWQVARATTDWKSLLRDPKVQLVDVLTPNHLHAPVAIAALKAGQIAGAALDVVVEEPMPAASPLWDLPNVLITPHSAGETRAYEDNVLDILIENLEHL